MPDTVLSAQLMLGELTPTGIMTKKQIGTAEFGLERVLGWGGMATVYVAPYAAGLKVVIKEMRPNNNPKIAAKMTSSFLREAEVQYNVGRWMSSNPHGRWSNKVTLY